MKRLISIFVTILMVTTMVLPTAVFADGEEAAFDPFAGDYVSAELTDNLFQQPGNVYVVDMAARIDKKADAIANQTRYLAKTSDFTADLSGWSRGLAGLQYISNSPAQGFAGDFTVEGQDTLVFSYALRNYGTTDSFVWKTDYTPFTMKRAWKLPVTIE